MADPDAAPPRPHRLSARLLVPLGVTQITSWGTLYYAFSIASGPMAADLGLAPSWVLAGLTWAVLVSGAVAPWVGATIDQWGGRRVMASASVCAALGCLGLALGGGLVGLFVSWTLLGVAMAGSLYDAAFATVVRTDPDGSRRTISLLTLVGGLASTAFWPLSAVLVDAVGWRGMYEVYAAVHLALCLPLHLGLPRVAARGQGRVSLVTGALVLGVLRRPAFWLVTAAFSLNAFLFAGLSIQLITVFQLLGHERSTALWLTGLIGPLQVGARALELTLGRRTDIQWVGLLAFALFPVVLVALLGAGDQTFAAVVFCLGYGVTNGLVTIVRGVLLKQRFGAEQYGLVSGLLSGISVVFLAIGPLVLGLLLSQQASPLVGLVFLLAVSVASLGFYVAALGSRSTAPGPS